MVGCGSVVEGGHSGEEGTDRWLVWLASEAIVRRKGDLVCRRVWVLD